MTTVLQDVPFEWLVCPITKEPLTRSGNLALSSQAGYPYHADYHFWNFLPHQLEPHADGDWEVWKELQSNGEVSYQHDPEHNLGVGKRKDFLAFAEFCAFHGNILDVGVGPQKIPTHMQFCETPEAFFVGIDPLCGEQPRDFAFIQGLGEYLPFRGTLFDQVLYVTSLDHFLDPTSTLREAKRVLKAQGEICVWLGEKDPKAPKPENSPEWYQTLHVPEGADDPFHFRRLSSAAFEKLSGEVSLHVKQREIVVVDQWRKNIFYKLVT